MSDKLTKENNNSIVFYLNKDIYNIKTIMKAAYNFIEDFYIFLNYVDSNIEVVLESKEQKSSEEMKRYKGEFHNELLRQNIRFIVAKDTKNIRKLVMGRALYDTCIEYDEPKEEIEENSSKLKDEFDILANWFDKNEG